MVILCSLTTLFLPASKATHDPNDFWVEDFPTGGEIIHGSSSTNVWSISTEQDVLIAYRRTSAGVWQAFPTGIAGESVASTVADIWVLSPTQVYVINSFGDTGFDFAAFDGTTFNGQTLGNDNIILESIFAVSANDIWISGRDTGIVPTGPVVFHWDGVSWTNSYPFGSSDPNRVTRIFGFSSTDIWVIEGTSAGSKLWHYDGTWTMTADFASIPSVNSVKGKRFWGTSANNLYFATGSSGLWRITAAGTAATNVSPTGFASISVWGSSTTDVWAISSALGVIHSSDGVSFTPEPEPVSNIGNSIWLASATEIYTSGQISFPPQDPIYKMQINPSVALPSLTGLEWNPADVFVTASQAQCNGDDTSLGVNVEPSIGAGGVNAYILNSDTGIVVESWSQGVLPATGVFFNLNNKHFHTSRVYPPGDYSFLVTVDVSGLLTVDNYAAASFNVPDGTCGDTEIDVDAIAEIVRFRSNQTNTYVNTTNETLHTHIEIVNDTLHLDHIQQGIYPHCESTATQSDCEGIRANLTQVHSHIDAHFNQTWEMIEGINMTVGNITLTNFTATMSIEQFEFVIWILLVTAAFLCASSEKLSLVIAAIPIGLVSIIYGVKVFDNSAFDIAAIAAGVIIASTVFVWRSEQKKNRKAPDEYQEDSE